MKHLTTVKRTDFIYSKTTSLEQQTVESFMLISYLLCQRFSIIPCTALHLMLERSHGLEMSESTSITHKTFTDTHYPWLNSVQ